MATKRLTVQYNDFSGGWAGDVDRARAKKGQWFGQDVMLYADGLLGPRHPLRQVTITAAPTVDNGRVDEAIIYENLGATRPVSAVIVAGDDLWYVVNFASFDTAAVIDETRSLGGTADIAGVAIDSVNGRVYFTLATTTPRGRYHAPTASLTNVVFNGTQPDGQVLVRWNERMVYAARDAIFFSDANTFTSWPAANTMAVGDGAPIVAIIPTPLALYVAKTSGWWMITGVLGSTATQRQVKVGAGVEPAQITGGSGSTTKNGSRLVAAWRRGMMYLRRRANDYRSDLAAAGVTSVAVELSELKSFTGADTEEIAIIKASRQARLVAMPHATAVVDCQNVPESPSGVQHVVYLVDDSKRLSRHVFASSVTSTVDQVMCPLQAMEGANSPVAGYEADHLWLAFADVSNVLQLRALRYKASRPGYGSDDPAQQVSTTNGGQNNIVGVVELPDWWDDEGRQIKVQTVHVSGRKYDNSTAAGYVSTARLRAQATLLGRLDQTGSAANNPSALRNGFQEVIGLGAGDQDFYCAVNVNDGGWGCGFRLRLEMEMCSIRSVWVQLETGDLVK